MALRLAKRRANWRANRRRRREEGLFPAFYYSLGCVPVGQGHEHIMHKHIPFTMARYLNLVERLHSSGDFHEEKIMLEIARTFNLRDNRTFGLAGAIYQMVEKLVKVELIDKCILADHLNVWKNFDIGLISRHEWDKVNSELDRLIATVA